MIKDVIGLVMSYFDLLKMSNDDKPIKPTKSNNINYYYRPNNSKKRIYS